MVLIKKVIPYIVSGLIGIILVLLFPNTFSLIFEWKDAHLTEILIALLFFSIMLIVPNCKYKKINMAHLNILLAW